MTDLLWKRRVPKCDVRVSAVGDLDELSAALGLARSHSECPAELNTLLQQVQKDLLHMAPGLMADTQDRDRFVHSDMPRLGSAEVLRLEDAVEQLEGAGVKFCGFVLPGDTEISARLHMARTIARRAERAITAIHEAGFVVPPVSYTYLNRLSDVLWLWAIKLG